MHEAQAHVVPVIAARWAGIPEVVTHGETGFLLDTRVAPLQPHVATTTFGETDRTHFDATCSAAEKAWAGPAPSRPLVHLDDVLAAQAAGTLEPGHRLRMADEQPLPLLTRGSYSESSAQLSCVLGLFQSGEVVSVVDAAASAAAFARAATPAFSAGLKVIHPAARS